MCVCVITEHPVTDYTPLQRVSGSREGVVTQYAASTKANAVEKIGLLKMDFLGLKNLTIIQNTLRIVRKTRGVDINIEDIPLDDEATYRLLQEAHTTGIFQLESSGMKRYLIDHSFLFCILQAKHFPHPRSSLPCSSFT